MTTHLSMPLEVHLEGDVVVVQPAPIYNVRAFTLYLSSASARALAGVLLAHASEAEIATKARKTEAA